jgi:hypothetical protein
MSRINRLLLQFRHYFASSDGCTSACLLLQGRLVMPAGLTKQIFGVKVEYQLIQYLKDDLLFELFITPHRTASVGKFEHVCLAIPYLGTFVDTCRAMDVRIHQISRGESNLT